MAETKSRILVLAPAEEASLLAALLDESGYLPLLVSTVAEALNVVTEAPPAAALFWVQPGDAESLASLRTLADRDRGLPVLAVVGADGAAMRGALTQFGARAAILLIADAGRESLEPMRQLLEATTREEKRRRLGHAIP